MPLALLSHGERIEAAHRAIDYLMSRHEEELSVPVLNCPGWTVYNTAVHVGRVSLSWGEWIRSDPGDPDARERGFAQLDQRSGVGLDTLAGWAHGTVDLVDGDESRAAFMPFVGGVGSHGLWARHCSAEIGIHRVDVEDALGHDHGMSDTEAFDAACWAIETIQPALAARGDVSLPSLRAELVSHDGADVGIVERAVGSTEAPVVIQGPAVQVLLAVWGRPHDRITVTNPEGFAVWTSTPGEQAQWPVWD